MSWAIVEPFLRSGPLLIGGLVLLLLLVRFVSGLAVKVLFVGSILLLLLVSSPLLANTLLENLEGQYQPAELSETATLFSNVPEGRQYIVVLGAGNRPDPNFPPTSTLTASSVLRLVEAVRLARWFPRAKLVISGAGVDSSGALQENQAEAFAMTQLAAELGVAPTRIVVHPKGNTPAANAKFISKLIGDTPFLLVTSAASMARAKKAFEERGLIPLPAPTNFTVENRANYWVQSLVPDSSSFTKLDTVLKEVTAGWLKKQKS